jgi:hypothetical protein
VFGGATADTGRSFVRSVSLWPTRRQATYHACKNFGNIFLSIGLKCASGYASRKFPLKNHCRARVGCATLVRVKQNSSRFLTARASHLHISGYDGKDCLYHWRFGVFTSARWQSNRWFTAVPVACFSRSLTVAGQGRAGEQAASEQLSESRCR